MSHITSTHLVYLLLAHLSPYWCFSPLRSLCLVHVISYLLMCVVSLLCKTFVSFSLYTHPLSHICNKVYNYYCMHVHTTRMRLHREGYRRHMYA